MTATITEPDVTVLDELDFDPSCTMRLNPGDPDCPRTAKWVIYWIACCPEGGKQTLVCDQHKDHVLTYAGWVECDQCGTKVRPFAKAVDRIEPLNSGGGRG